MTVSLQSGHEPPTELGARTDRPLPRGRQLDPLDRADHRLCQEHDHHQAPRQAWRRVRGLPERCAPQPSGDPDRMRRDLGLRWNEGQDHPRGTARRAWHRGCLDLDRARPRLQAHVQLARGGSVLRLLRRVHCRPCLTARQPRPDHHGWLPRPTSRPSGTRSA